MGFKIDNEKIRSCYVPLKMACGDAVKEAFDQAAAAIVSAAEQNDALQDVCKGFKIAQDTYNTSVLEQLNLLVTNFETVIEISDEFKNINYSENVGSYTVDVSRHEISTPSYNL